MTRVLSVLLALAFGHPVLAAGLAQESGKAEAVSLEPIECWWRTDTGAVRVGERFTLVLTCSVVETADTKVVPDQSRLDPSVLQLPPFEVVSGTQASEVRSATRRTFQYEYTTRYVGEDIGGDLALSPLTVTYRVQSRMPQDAAIESRERQYILPAVTIRILSLVPAMANDIRDQPAETFRQIDARRFRASLLRVIAGFLFVVGAVVAMSGVARVLRRVPRRTPAAAGLVSDTAILRRVLAEFDEVRRLRSLDGWTDALAARTLAALRLVATCVLGHPAVQVRDKDGLEPSEGQLVIARRWPGRGATLVSSAATPLTLGEGRRRLDDLRGERLADLERAMDQFAAAAYGRDASGFDNADLDEALDVGVRALERVRGEHAWPARTRRALASSLARLRDRL